MLSYAENIPRILEAVKKSGAKKILDIGPAYGKYGLLIREQAMSDKAAGGEMIPTDEMTIDCLELTEYFLEYGADSQKRQPSRLETLYNKVYEGDFLKESPELFAEYDLLLLIDVVEHWDKEVIKKFLRECPVPVLVSTPKEVVMYEHKYYGDPHHHVSQWTGWDFVSAKGPGLGFVDYSTELSHIFIV